MNTWLSLLRDLYIDRFDPTLEQVLLALQVALCMIIISIITYTCQLHEALWLFLPAGFISLGNQGISKRRRIGTMTLTTIILSILVGTASILGHWLWAYMPLCFVVAGVGFYLCQYGQPILIASVTSVVLISIAGFKPTTVTLALDRSLNILIAGGLILVVTNLIFPYRPAKHLKKRLQLCSYQLKQLCQATILSSLCGTAQSRYRTQLKNYTLSNLQICRQLIKRYPDDIRLEQWRIIFSFYNSLNALCLLLSEPGNSTSFNQLSRYLFHINQVLCSCLQHLNTAHYHSSLNKLKDIEQQLTEEAKTHNEDIASLAFLMTRFHTRLEDYHALIKAP